MTNRVRITLSEWPQVPFTLTEEEQQHLDNFRVINEALLRTAEQDLRESVRGLDEKLCRTALPPESK